jgi:hypothetical protein
MIFQLKSKTDSLKLIIFAPHQSDNSKDLDQQVLSQLQQ